jgi:hypothetical protein
MCRAGAYAPLSGARECTLIMPGFYLLIPGVTSLGFEPAHVPLSNRSAVAEVISGATVEYLCPGSTVAEHSSCSASAKNVLGLCDDGYYCVAGSHTPTPLTLSGLTYGYAHGDICPIGHQCPSGASAPVPCAPGSFQDEPAQPVCKTVQRGRYATDGRAEVLPCPPGHYCPEGDPASPIPCPLSTFGNLSSAYAPEHCHACIPGMFCTSPGIARPSGLCDAGFLCDSPGSTTPVGQRIGFPAARNCPRGYFCPAGSAGALACPAGTYNTNPNQGSLDSCVPCPAGTFCEYEGTGNKDQPEPCAAGFACTIPAKTMPVVDILIAIDPPSWATVVKSSAAINKVIGHVTAAPEQFRCPRGFRCPAGTANPLECCHDDNHGDVSFNASCSQYQPDEGKATCVSCPAGTRCAQPAEGVGYSFKTAPCPVGHYCPQGSLPVPCGAGTYTTFTNLTSQVYAHQQNICSGPHCVSISAHPAGH